MICPPDGFRDLIEREGQAPPLRFTGSVAIAKRFKFGFVGEFIRPPASPEGFPGGEAPWGKKEFRGAVSEGGTPSDARRKPQENWL